MPKSKSREDAPPPSFAVKLKAIRDAAGLTQTQLAEASGLHLGAIFKLEQGLREPTWQTVQALAAALGVDCTAFSETAQARSAETKPQEDAGPAEQDTPAKKGRKRK